MTAFLLEELTAREGGSGPPLRTDETPVLVTLGITKVEEQQSIDVAIWGSPDGESWGAKPLLHFPQKFYLGIWRIYLAHNPGWLQARWRMNRWGRGDMHPLFCFYVFLATVNAPSTALAEGST